MKTPLLSSDLTSSQKIQFLKFDEACGFDDIPNECLQHPPSLSTVHLTHLFNQSMPSAVALSGTVEGGKHKFA